MDEQRKHEVEQQVVQVADIGRWFILADHRMEQAYLYDHNVVVATVRVEDRPGKHFRTLVISCPDEFLARYQLGRIASGLHHINYNVYVSRDSAIAAAVDRRF